MDRWALDEVDLSVVAVLGVLTGLLLNSSNSCDGDTGEGGPPSADDKHWMLIKKGESTAIRPGTQYPLVQIDAKVVLTTNRAYTFILYQFIPGGTSLESVEVTLREAMNALSNGAGLRYTSRTGDWSPSAVAELIPLYYGFSVPVTLRQYQETDMPLLNQLNPRMDEDLAVELWNLTGHEAGEYFDRDAIVRGDTIPTWYYSEQVEFTGQTIDIAFDSFSKAGLGSNLAMFDADGERMYCIPYWLLGVTKITPIDPPRTSDYENGRLHPSLYLVIVNTTITFKRGDERITADTFLRGLMAGDNLVWFNSDVPSKIIAASKKELDDEYHTIRKLTAIPRDFRDVNAAASERACSFAMRRQVAGIFSAHGFRHAQLEYINYPWEEWSYTGVYSFRLPVLFSIRRDTHNSYPAYLGFRKVERGPTFWFTNRVFTLLDSVNPDHKYIDLDWNDPYPFLTDDE